MLETVACWIIAVGLAFDLFGCIGLVRLPDVYNRAQAATKCVTLGTCTVLAGVAVLAFGGGAALAGMGVRALLCIAFVLVTSPVAAHAVCRGAYVSGVRLWPGSVIDEFATRAEQVRRANEAEEEGVGQDEEAETA